MILLGNMFSMPHYHRNSFAFGLIRRNLTSGWNLGCLRLGNSWVNEELHFGIFTFSWVFLEFREEGEEIGWGFFIIIDGWSLIVDVDAVRDGSSVFIEIIFCWSLVFLIFSILIFYYLLVPIFELVIRTKRRTTIFV